MAFARFPLAFGSSKSSSPFGSRNLFRSLGSVLPLETEWRERQKLHRFQKGDLLLGIAHYLRGGSQCWNRIGVPKLHRCVDGGLPNLSVGMRQGAQYLG